MKLRVLFLKKIHIIYLTIFLITCLTLIFSLLKKESNPVFNIIEDNTTIRADLTGDGIDDILYIKTEKDKYYIQINVKNESFYLAPNRQLNTVGYFSTYWPMKVTLMDITRDKIPEIFVQASHKNTPIQHIFTWTGKDFKDVYCSTNNVIGFIDSQNNKTPKIVSGNISSNKTNYLYHMLIGNEIQNISYEKNVPGKETVFSFIKYIESLPDGESNMPKDIFSQEVDGKALSPIGKLCAENNIYNFQDAIFMDTKFDSAGDAIEVKWTLNFRGVSKTNNTHSKGYSLSIKLKNSKDNKENFKIFSISLQ